MEKKRLSKEEFIHRARLKHGDKFDYSKVNFTNVHQKVTIICPIHGEFEQVVKEHLRKGCNKCAIENRKRPIYGVGIYDSDEPTRGNICYIYWKGMLKRCYSSDKRLSEGAYKGCSVCDEWKKYTSFRLWFNNNYIKKYQIDKDILFKRNKIYSPSTCCFVPQYINKLLTNRKGKRGKYPLGVTYNARKNKYIAQISENGRQKQIGCYDNPNDAFLAYKKEKELNIQRVAFEAYKNNEITKKVYDALNSYRIEEDD